jgi:hypothetical protein
VNAVKLTRFVAPLVLSLVATAHPASANVFVDLDVAKNVQSVFVDQMHVGAGQSFVFRLAALNATSIPLYSICDIPALKVRVGNTLAPFRIREVLQPGKVSGMTIPAVCTKEGTFKVSVLLHVLNPFNGKFIEIVDSVTLVCSAVSGGDSKGGQQAGGTGGQQTGGTGGQQTGAGGKKDDAGTLGGTTGGQQSGGAGGKKDDAGTLGGSGSQQSGGTGGKVDDKGGKKNGAGTAGGQQNNGGGTGTGGTGNGTGGGAYIF